MAILDFQKPNAPIMMDATDSFAKFEFYPLEPGYGVTVGNALRRILLASLEGYAVDSIKIDGVPHEFGMISGVKEDVTNIILNLKQVRFRPTVPGATEETIKLEVSNTKTLKAGDFNGKLTAFEVLNPELLICNIDDEYSFTIELSINKGRGYVSAQEKEISQEDPFLIPIDSIYTPILNVEYHTDSYRVEQKTDYEKLEILITTDGSITPKDALKDAARILIEHFGMFSDDLITVEEPVNDFDDEFDGEMLHMRQLLKSNLIEMNLSVRALNCLKAAEVHTLGQLVAYQKSELMKFRNFGKKSLDELQELLDKMNLSFGMDVSKYKLDRD